MKPGRFVSILLLTIVSFPIQADDDFCTIKNSAFQAGESITYKAYYSLASMYLSGGRLFSA